MAGQLGRPFRPHTMTRPAFFCWCQVMALITLLLLANQALPKLQQSCEDKIEAVREQHVSQTSGDSKHTAEEMAAVRSVAMELRKGLEAVETERNGLSAEGVKSMLRPYTSMDTNGAAQRRLLAATGFQEASTWQAWEAQERQRGGRRAFRSVDPGQRHTLEADWSRGADASTLRIREGEREGGAGEGGSADPQMAVIGGELIARQSDVRKRSRSLQGEEGARKPHPQYHLSAMIFNRIFVADKLNFTIHEIWQWLEYLRYAGVEHFYWYDCAQAPEEWQEEGLAPYVEAGLMTYHRFHDMFPGNFEYHYEQDNSERHFLQNYRKAAKWALICDVDEYMFAPQDLRPGFLARFVREVEGMQPSGGDMHWDGFGDYVSQIRIQNVFFKGWPQREIPALLIERYQRREERVAEQWGMRTKTIVRMEDWDEVMTYQPHFMKMTRGATYSPPLERIRMNHYWGARGTNFEPETSDFLAKIHRDDSIQPIAEALKERLRSGAEFLDAMPLRKELGRLLGLAAELEEKLQSVGRTGRE